MPHSRILPFPAVCYLRKEVAFNTSGIDTGVAMNASVPPNSIIIGTSVSIDTVFNAASTNVLTVGTVSTAYNNLIAAGDVDETSLGVTTITSKSIKTGSSSTDVYIKYAQTGTAATTGAATVVVMYVPLTET